MKKYDCNKALDYAHERARMCHSFKYCKDGCPLKVLHSCDTDITQEHIDIIQKWSDEHPEPLKN